MKNLILILLCITPALLLAQNKSWSINSELGVNLSMNKIQTSAPYKKYMLNKRLPGGYWALNVAYQFSNKSQFHFGIDHAAYTYHYYYEFDKGAGGGSRASTFIWGFPIGLQHAFLENDCMRFSAGYGLKYRYKQAKKSEGYNHQLDEYDDLNKLIFSQEIREFNSAITPHLLSLYTYGQVTFKLSRHIQLSFKATYQQGLIKHEQFRIEAINIFSSEEAIQKHCYRYSSRASYLSFGLCFHYICLKKSKNAS